MTDGVSERRGAAQLARQYRNHQPLPEARWTRTVGPLPPEREEGVD